MSSTKYEFGEDEELDQLRIDVSITRILKDSNKKDKLGNLRKDLIKKQDKRR
jgi:hypothetical protein